MNRSAAFFTMSSFLLVAGMASAHDLVPLWESRLVSVSATFYTTYYNDHRVALDSGHEDHGVTAWVPCSNNSLNGPNGEISYKGSAAYPDVPAGDWITPSRFGHGYPAAMNFACAQPSGALPLYSMWGGAPYNDYLYTTSVAEFNTRKSMGYSFGRVEGYVFTTQVAGSTPLYRLSLGANIANHDQEHRYTTSTVAKQVLLSAGWSDEGITGYVFPYDNRTTVGATQFTGTYNGYNVSPSTTVSVPIRNVVPSTSSFTVGGNTTTIQYGFYGSNATVRPTGAVWQNVSFDFYTGTFFSPGSTFNHMPIYLHYASTSGTTQLSAIPPYDGIALVLVPGNTMNGVTCGAPSDGGQLFFEIGAARIISCAPNLASTLKANSWYKISYSLDDSANVRVNVMSYATGLAVPFFSGGTTFTTSLSSNFSCPFSTTGLTPDNVYCTNPYNVRGFPKQNTGYMWFPLIVGASNTSAQMYNTLVKWLDVNLNPLN